MRTGFEWTPLNNVTIKDQVYSWRAKANWIDSETYAFDDGAEFAPNMIDRDRFFVTHDQQMIGDNTDLTWDSWLFGMDNRFAAQLQASRNWITFTEEGDPRRLIPTKRLRRRSRSRTLRSRSFPIPESAGSPTSPDRLKIVSRSRPRSR